MFVNSGEVYSELWGNYELSWDRWEFYNNFWDDGYAWGWGGPF